MDARASLLDQLARARAHVLATVDGLSDEQLDLVLVESGWSMSRMVSHLLWDDEMLWIGAILLGDRRDIGELRDGWESADPSGARLVAQYRRTVARHDEALRGVDFDAKPRWWPEPNEYAGPVLETGWEVIGHVLTETAAHAGHLDIVRERIDGHQHLVVD